MADADDLRRVVQAVASVRCDRCNVGPAEISATFASTIMAKFSVEQIRTLLLADCMEHQGWGYIPPAPAGEDGRFTCPGCSTPAEQAAAAYELQVRDLLWAHGGPDAVN